MYLTRRLWQLEIQLISMIWINLAASICLINLINADRATDVTNKFNIRMYFFDWLTLIDDGYDFDWILLRINAFNQIRSKIACDSEILNYIKLYMIIIVF